MYIGYLSLEILNESCILKALKTSAVKIVVCFKLKQTKVLLWYSKGSTRIEFPGNKSCFLIHLSGHGSCHNTWCMTLFTVFEKPSDWTWKAWNQEMRPRFLGLIELKWKVRRIRRKYKCQSQMYNNETIASHEDKSQLKPTGSVLRILSSNSTWDARNKIHCSGLRKVWHSTRARKH